MDALGTGTFFRSTMYTEIFEEALEDGWPQSLVDKLRRACELDAALS